MFCLDLLAYKATDYKSSYLSLHPVPPKVLLEVSVNFSASKVYQIRGTVGFRDQLPSNFPRWYTESAFEPKRTISMDDFILSQFGFHLFSDLLQNRVFLLNLLDLLN